MSKEKSAKPKGLFLAFLLMLLCLVLTACPAPVQPGASGEAVTPGTTGGESGEFAESPLPQPEVVLDFWLPVELAWMSDTIKEQIEFFTSSNPTLTVEIISLDALLPKLEAAIAAGTPPAIVLMDHEKLQYLRSLSSLLPLEELRDDDFLPGLLEENTFNSQIYGAPWVRFGCTQRYLTLSGFLDHPQANEAYALIKHLIQAEQQIRNFDTAGLLPTRQSAYDVLGIDCPPLREVLLPSPVDYNRIVEIVQKRAPNLQAILDQNSEELSSQGLLEGQQTLNPFLATAAITYDEQFPDQETVEFDDPFEPTGTILTVVAPVTINFSEEAFEKALLSESGVIVGAFFGVDGAIKLNGANEGSFEIEKDKDYAVKWRAIDSTFENVEFYLIDAAASTEEIAVGTITLSTMGGNIQPFVTMEIGSCEVCWSGPDNRGGCRTFHSQSKASKFKQKKEGEGATITTYTCN